MPQVQQRPGARPNWLLQNPFAPAPGFPAVVPHPLMNPMLGRPPPFNPVNSAPQSRPVPGFDWMQALANAGPRGTGLARSGPQGEDEMRIAYGARRALAPAVGGVTGARALAGDPNAMLALSRDVLAPVAGKAASAVGQEVGNAFRYLTATPNSDLELAYNAILGVEGGTDPKTGAFRTSPKGAVGPGQVMPGTGPEAAKLAGLPWDEQRFRTDAAYNRALGFAYFKEQVRQNNGDVIKAAAAYNAGPRRLQQAQQQAAKTGQPWTAFLPSETQRYIPDFMQRMNQLASNFGAPAPGFNPQPYQQAMQAQDAAASLLTTPYGATFSEQPLPERPKPAELQAPDFAAGDAAFQATMPKNPFDDPKERVRTLRQQYFKGIGQAMASLSGEEGIGTMLMRLGSGALMGRAKGEELIDDREEEFEARMVEFNRALASRNDQQAVAVANVLNQNISQRNQYADQVWSDSIAQIQRKQPQVQGDKLITFDRDPEDPNKWKMNVTPLGYGVLAESLINKANIGIQMGQASAAAGQFAYQSNQVAARTALGVAVQQSMAQGNGQATGEGILTEAASRARAAVQTGSWRSLFNDPRRAQILEGTASARAYAQLGIQLPEGEAAPRIPLEGSAMARFQETYEDVLTGIIYEEAMRLGQLDRLLTSSVGSAAKISQQSGSMKRTQRTDWRGRTSSSVSWDTE